MGYEARGFDVSEYAIRQADPETRPHLILGDRITSGLHFDWILAKDVLEHTDESEAVEILRALRQCCDKLFVAVPLGNGHAYTIPEMELDVTHKIRKPLWWWTGIIEDAGFKVEKATFSMTGVKENWTGKYKFGNGFIIAK